MIYADGTDADPDRSALAVESASVGSDFPTLRRFRRSTSTTTIP